MGETKNVKDVELLKILCLDPTFDFWVLFRDQNDFEKESGVIRHHPGLISNKKYIILKEIYQT